MHAPLRVGVVGCGVGKFHLDAYQSLTEQFQVIALCDIDESKSRAMADEYHVPRVVGDIKALCRMAEVDIVDICTPSYLHYVQSSRALEAGKHVICEKPLVGSLQEVDALIEAEARTGKRVMPIFQNRFGVGAQKLKFLIEQGIAGRAYLTTAETAWRRKAEYYLSPWRGRWHTELGGALVTLAIHAHDVVYYLLGPARRVSAYTATLVNPIETEDCVSAAVEMADGSLCTLAVTTGSAQEITRERFCFSNLTAESNARPYQNTAEPWTFTADSPEVEQKIQDALNRFVALPEGFVGQFSRFYNALAQQTELPVTLADARAAVELITAIYYSARTHEVVELPLTPEHPWYAGWVPHMR